MTINEVSLANVLLTFFHLYATAFTLARGRNFTCAFFLVHFLEVSSAAPTVFTRWLSYFPAEVLSWWLLAFVTVIFVFAL